MILRVLKGLAVGGLLALVAVAVVLQFTSIHTDYLMDKVGSQVVQLSPPSNSRSGGTGFAVITPNGNLVTLTNAHVCRVAENDEMHALIDGSNQYVTLRVIEISNEYDLCVLSALPLYTGLSLAGSFSRNDDIAIIGHPHLEPLTLQTGAATNAQNVTLVIGSNWTEHFCNSAKGEYLDLSQDYVAAFMGLKSYCIKTYFNVVRVTTRIFPGNSGSPAVNFFGSVVGIVFAGNSETNWGFVVPLHQIKDFLSRY